MSDLAALHARYDHAITFCVHVHNRFHQVRRTLPENLAVVRSQPGIGMVLLNYNSQDELDDWVRASCCDDIAAGRLLYAREGTVRHFHASKSKNLAHRLGPGRVLVNLDADNFIGTTLPFVRQMAASSNRLLVHLWSGTWKDGTYGRIAVSCELFHELGGYDESFLPIGHQDTDLILRARQLEADVVTVSGASFHEASGLRVEAIANSKREALRHTGYTMSFELMNSLNTWMGRIKRRRRGPIANPRGWGRGTVEVNFETELTLA